MLIEMPSIEQTAATDRNEDRARIAQARALVENLFERRPGLYWLLAWALVSPGIVLNWLRNLAAHDYDNSADARGQLAIRRWKIRP